MNICAAVVGILLLVTSGDAAQPWSTLGMILGAILVITLAKKADGWDWVCRTAERVRVKDGR